MVGDPRVAVYVPPPSPYGLIEEQLYDNPWKLLVACILLNKTSATQVLIGTQLQPSILRFQHHSCYA